MTDAAPAKFTIPVPEWYFPFYRGMSRLTAVPIALAVGITFTAGWMKVGGPWCLIGIIGGLWASFWIGKYAGWIWPLTLPLLLWLAFRFL